MKSRIRHGVFCVETEYTDLSGLPRKHNIPAPCCITATHAMAHSFECDGNGPYWPDALDCSERAMIARARRACVSWVPGLDELVLHSRRRSCSPVRSLHERFTLMRFPGALVCISIVRDELCTAFAPNKCAFYQTTCTEER
jgi:hypothetical protein